MGTPDLDRGRGRAFLALALSLSLSLSLSRSLSLSLSRFLSLPARPGSAGSPPQKTKQRGAEDVDARGHQRTGPRHRGRRGEVLDGGRQGRQPRRHTGRHRRADSRQCGGDGGAHTFDGEGEGWVGRRANRQHDGGGSGGGGGDGQGRGRGRGRGNDLETLV